MKALVWTDKMKLVKKEVDEPTITSPTQVKVKIHLTGICGTDLALITQKEQGIGGIIRGHEAVGTVVSIGESVRNTKIGDRVVIDPNQYCGQCFNCRKGKTNLCSGNQAGSLDIAGINIHGTFAEYFVCDEKFIYKLPDTMSWEAALMIEPLACVLHNLTEAGLVWGDSVLVLGSGPMGILCQMVARRFTHFTAATEKNEYRLAFAKKTSHYAFHPDLLSQDTIYRINSGRKFDIVIDAVGNQLEAAESMVERGGRIILLGIDPNYKFLLSPVKYLSNSIRILGLGEYNQMFETALQVASTMPELHATVTKKYQFDDYETAINELLGFNPSTQTPVKCETVKTALQL